MSKRKTHDEYVAEVAIKNPNIEVIGRYIDSKTKILHRCKIDGYEWYAKPANILFGKGCPKCAGNVKKTHDEYVKELNIVNPNIEVIGKYINAQSPILHKCLIDGFEWYASPSHTLNGTGCPKCAGNIKRTHDDYVYELAQKNPSIEVIGKYIDAKTNIMHHCLKHNIFWEISPSNALAGHGCVECKKEKISNSNNKTHEQYVEEVKKINPNIEVIGEYINATTPILHYCIKHNNYWNTTPDSILHGHECPICWREKLKNINRMTHSQYLDKLNEVNPDIEVIESYIDIKTPILHRCKIHNIKWLTSPASTLQGCGCTECGKEKSREQRTKTHEQYVEELRVKNPDIIPMETYVNAFTPILHKCLIDGFEWYARPGNILFGYGCPKCAGNTQRTHKEYIDEVFAVNPNIKVIGKYINANTPILHKCLIDGYEWKAAPFSILRGSGCPKCAGIIKKTHDEYVKELYKINPDIKVIGEYINARTPILHKCLIHNYEWYVTPHTMLQGNRCPRCHETIGERQIRQWLEKNNIEYIYQQPFDDCRDIKPLPFDFYLPDYNIAIEFDHIQHFKPVDYFGGEEKFKIQQEHDRIKNEYCQNNGISLLRIPYFKNVEEELNNFLFI